MVLSKFWDFSVQYHADQEILQFYERKISVKNRKIYDLKNADHFFCGKRFLNNRSNLAEKSVLLGHNAEVDH